MGPKPSKGRARRTHSLGGCATCRRRHVKCDQVQPLCLTCKAVGVVCEGYASNFQWVSTSNAPEKSKVQKPEPNTTRRHLYSEKSRASMSTALTAKLSANSVDASLNQIDSWSRNQQTSDQDNLEVGPFGVLSFNISSSSSSAVPTDNLPPPLPPLAEAEAEPVEEHFPTPSTLDPLMSLDDSLQWADLFALDFGNEFLMQQDLFAPIVQDLVPNNNATGGEVFGQPQDTGSRTQDDPQMQNSALPPILGTLMVPVSPLHDTSAPTTDILGDVQTLLQHFQDNVINAMAGVPWTEKSPWKILLLTNAVQTLADLTYLRKKTVKHANAANLYSIVSCSARHLSDISAVTPSGNVDKWGPIAEWALQRAKSHLEQSMRKEFQGREKAKYKDQLMATMSTMAASQLAANQRDVRRYMLESERVLRLRGLAKRELSRKARLLHHIYTWCRIVGESGYVIHDYSSYAPAVQNLSLQHQKRVPHAGEVELADLVNTTSTNHTSRLDDFLRVETQHDSDLEIDEPKEAAVGLHDIHLEDSRDDPGSMYLQIYGIPETWLSLVSQTTRLANVMDTLKVSNKETNIAFQNALQKRASRLENMICSFAFKTASAHSTPLPDADSGIGASSVLPNQHMVQALNSGLVIFFYRRIRDVNPWILQSHVDDVIKALENFDKALVERNMVGPGTAWPAFMAGCEAIAPHRREALLRWIQAGQTKSGMRSYKAAEEVLREVWKRRDDANSGPSPRTAKPTGSTTTSSRTQQPQWTWVDILREQKSWLMLY